jgi:zona occludens toxin (predicted ATPase)
MIEAFTGLPGQGKTYNMTRRAIKVMAKGRKVYANYQLKGSEYFKELSELVGVKDALILVDEAGIYLPSQAWKSIPFEFIRQLRQHRHDGLDLWYTAQDMQDVATYLRRLTQFQHDFSRIWKVYYGKTTNPRNREKYGFEIGYITPKVYQYYDTTENIEFAEYLQKTLAK